MRNMMKRLRNERGLTLVELLAVIVILAIIAVIAFVFIGGIIENSKKDAHIANAQQVISAAKLSEATGGSADTNAEELQEGDFLDQILNPWEKKQYEDLEGIKVSKVTEGENKGQYQIKMLSDGNDCDLNATEAELSKKDRKELCD